jgi:hypothetical protein
MTRGSVRHSDILPEHNCGGELELPEDGPTCSLRNVLVVTEFTRA